MRRDILTERAHQIVEQREWEIERSNGPTHRDEHERAERIGVAAIFNALRSHVHPWARDRLVQPVAPDVKSRRPLLRRIGALVGDVVRQTGEGIHGGDVRPHERGQQARRDRKILVVGVRQRLACRVGGRERPRSDRH